MNHTTIYVDGATGSKLHSGIAAVAQTEDGQFLGWQSQQLGCMTNNEAEYSALLLGIRLAQHLNLQRVKLVSDSEVIVRQMQGRSRVLSARLKKLHQQACHQAGFLEHVTFTHVLRRHNRLADALAANAMEGKIVQRTTRRKPTLFTRFPRFSWD